jgi:hypothetical protein
MKIYRPSLPVTCGPPAGSARGEQPPEESRVGVGLRLEVAVVPAEVRRRLAMGGAVI